MSFTATPTDGSSTPIPMSSVVPDGTNTPLALEGGPSITTGGNTLAPVSMYVKDGNDIAQGASTDAANANSVIGQLKQIKTNTASVTIGGGTVAATQSGTWNITNVSGTVSLPTGAATSAKQPALGTAGSASTDVLSVQGIASMTALKVDGSGVTQPVSGTVSVNALPTGANTVGNVGIVAGSATIGGVKLIDTGGTNVASISAGGAVKVDGSGVTQPVSGTFWQATQPVSGTVTANVGTTNGLALDASVNGVLVSQGSTTSGEKGPLVQGAVTTAAPTYTTAQTSPISLTTAGAVRVDASSTTQPVSGTFWQATQPISGTVTANQGGTWTVQPGNTANTTAWKVDGSAVTQPVNISQVGGVSTQMMTGDAVAQANFPMQGIGLYNSSGSVVDRLRDAGSVGDTVTIGFIASAMMIFNGGSFDRVRTPTKFVPIAAVAITAGTPTIVWTPGSGRKFHLMGYNISLSVAGSVIFKDGSTTEIFRTSLMSAGTGLTNPGNFGNGYASNVANQALYMDSTATGSVTGFVFGTEEF